MRVVQCLISPLGAGYAAMRLATEHVLPATLFTEADTNSCSCKLRWVEGAPGCRYALHSPASNQGTASGWPSGPVEAAERIHAHRRVTSERPIVTMAAEAPKVVVVRAAAGAV